MECYKLWNDSTWSVCPFVNSSATVFPGTGKSDFCHFLHEVKGPFVIKQEELSRGVFIKRCSKNMQQIYRRTPMPKCDFNKNHQILSFEEKSGLHKMEPERAQNDPIFPQNQRSRPPQVFDVLYEVKGSLMIKSN